jgi:hypothetical protein
MILEALGEFDPPFSGGADQMDSAARRFGLQMKRAIGWTLIQTQTAVDALVKFREIQRRDPRTIGLFLFV